MRDEKIQTKKHKAYGIGTTTHELWQVGMETGGKLLQLNKNTHFNDSNMGDVSSLHSQHIPTLSITASSNRNQSFQRFDSGGFLFPLHSSFGFAHIIILGDSEKAPTS